MALNLNLQFLSIVPKMSDFIGKLNVIVLWIGNEEKTRSSVEVMSRTGTHTNTDRETPFQKGASHTI